METSNRRHYFADPTSLSHASQGSLSAVELDFKSLSHNSIFEGPFFLVPSRDWISITFSPLITSSALLPLLQIPEWGSSSVEREELLEVIKEDATCSPASSIYLTLASSGLTAYPVLSYPSKNIPAYSHLLLAWPAQYVHMMILLDKMRFELQELDRKHSLRL